MVPLLRFVWDMEQAQNSRNGRTILGPQREECVHGHGPGRAKDACQDKMTSAVPFGLGIPALFQGIGPWMLVQATLRQNVA